MASLSWEDISVRVPAPPPPHASEADQATYIDHCNKRIEKLLSLVEDFLFFKDQPKKTDNLNLPWAWLFDRVIRWHPKAKRLDMRGALFVPIDSPVGLMIAQRTENAPVPMILHDGDFLLMSAGTVLEVIHQMVRLLLTGQPPPHYLLWGLYPPQG